MKVIAVLMFVTLLQVRATGFAQQITLVQNGITLKKVFNEINKQTGYNILWSSKKIKDDAIVNVNFNKASISEALTQCLKDFPLTYAIQNKTIVIREKENSGSENLNTKPPVKISGKITDEKGEPIPGATVKIKGSGTGTSTDVNGTFVLNAATGDVITISSIGYVTTEITAESETKLVIVLKEAANQLNAVVITALGIKKQARSLSYNVQEISGDELTKVQDPNFMNSLEGKVAGATINSSSDGLGGSTRVILRGTKSINQTSNNANTNNALYVIDGIPLPALQLPQLTDIYSGAGQSGDGISNFNPDDIESISVLTGPASTALYGYQGASGVVLITMKKGLKDATSITFSNSTTYLSPFVLPQFQNTYGQDAPGGYTSWGPKLQTPSTYSPKDFFQTGVDNISSISLQTGTDKSQTYLSAGMVNGSGIINNNNLTRYNLTFRNTTKYLNDRITVDMGVMYMKVDEQNMLAQGQYFNPLVPIYLFPPGDDIRKYQVYQRYDPTRNFQLQFWPAGSQGFQMQNPYWITQNDLFDNIKNRYLLTGGVQYNINSWLNISSRVKLDQNFSDNEKKFDASTSGLFAGPAGFYNQNNINTRQTYADVLLNINKTIKDISISANIGASIQDEVDDNVAYGGNLQTVPNLFTYQNVGPSTAVAAQSNYHTQTQSVFATAQVGYKSMVYLDVTGRNDWASQLANSSNSSFFYPSVGLSGVITDLLNIKSNVLTFLKARVSYSEVGNPPPSDITIPTHPFTAGYPDLSTYENIDLKPERTNSTEAGLDFVFGQNKVKLDVTAYRSSTYNQLFSTTVSPSGYGTENLYINAGQIDNKGIEATLAVNQKLGPVNWTTSVVFSLNRNKIISLLNNYKDPVSGANISLDSLDEGGSTGYRMELVKGGSMGDIYVNTLKTDEHGYIWVNSATYAVYPDQNTFVKAGSANPNFNLGWRNDFSFKGIDFSFLIAARVGGVGVSVTQAIMDAYGVSEASAQARDNGGAIVNGYKIPAEAYYQTIGGGTSGISSMYVYSATNVRLGEASVGYNIPIAKYLKFVKGFNVSLIGRNLFMFYNKAPFDPESTASTGTYYQGVDYFMQPSLRSVGFSAKLKF